MSEEHGLKIIKGTWDVLAPHFARGALFIASNELDLTEVGKAIAADDANSVASWLESKELRRPEELEVEGWSKSAHEEFASFIIVQPYVIIQLCQ